MSPAPSQYRSDRVALLAIVLLGMVLVWFRDVTFHGPDQMRDIEVARRLVHDGIWPVSGPSLFSARFQLPPGFYYVLALPLLVWDNNSFVFLVFGVLFTVSVGFLWRAVRDCFGSLAGLVYIVLAFPLFAGLYVHSAWNPALVMTLSNVVLALLLRMASGGQRGVPVLVLTAFLLLQVHPSFVPILCGIALFLLINPRRALQPAALVAMAFVLGAFGWWLVQSGQLGNLGSTAAEPLHATPGQAGLLSRLLDGPKWVAAAAMPLSAIRSIGALSPAVKGIAAGLLAALWIGVMAGFLFGLRDAAMRWVCSITVLWFVMSMGFLAQGAFWHLDVIYPWLAVIAAFGWARAAAAARLPVKAVVCVAGAAITLLLAAQGWMYWQLHQAGRFDMKLAPLFFPELEVGNQTIPSYTYEQQERLKQQLQDHGICDEDLAGKEKLIFGNMSIRMPIGKVCGARAPAADDSTRDFMAFLGDDGAFRLTRGLQPLILAGTNAIYRMEGPPTTINGQPGSQLLSARQLNYMLFEPAHSEHGIRIGLPLSGATVVRAALRCAQAYPVEQGSQWDLTGARQLAPMRSSQAWHLGSVYYDLEWTLAPATTPTEAIIASKAQQLDCDVSTTTRRISGADLGG